MRRTLDYLWFLAFLRRMTCNISIKSKIFQTDSELIDLAQTKEPIGKAAIYLKHSGPGWLQGAVTLGGGYLAGVLSAKGVPGYIGLDILATLAILGTVGFLKKNRA